MKGLMKIIGMILGILGLSGKASAKKKAKVKKIDRQVKKIQDMKVKVQKKKAKIKKAQKKKPVKKPNVTSAKKARASLKRRAKR